MLVALTLFLGIVAVAASWTEITERTGFFQFNLIATLAGVVGVFTALDLFLFFLLFLYGPRTPAQALALAKWLVGVIAVANLVTFLDVFNIPDLGIMVDRPDSRVAGPIGGVNQYGAVLALLFGPIVFQAVKLLPVSMALLSQAAALAFVAEYRRSPGAWPAALAGLACGIACTVRAEFLHEPESTKRGEVGAGIRADAKVGSRGTASLRGAKQQCRDRGKPTVPVQFHTPFSLDSVMV